jgi:hypothetical protein
MKTLYLFVFLILCSCNQLEKKEISDYYNHPLNNLEVKFSELATITDYRKFVRKYYSLNLDSIYPFVLINENEISLSKFGRPKGGGPRWSPKSKLWIYQSKTGYQVSDYNGILTEEKTANKVFEFYINRYKMEGKKDSMQILGFTHEPNEMEVILNIRQDSLKYVIEAITSIQPGYQHFIHNLANESKEKIRDLAIKYPLKIKLNSSQPR